MSALTEDPDGSYHVDIALAAKAVPTHLASLDTCSDLIEFIATFLHAWGYAPEGVPLQAFIDDGVAMFRGVCLGNSLAYELLPAQFTREVYVTFPETWDHHVFFTYDPANPLETLPAPEKPKIVYFPLKVGSLSNKVSVEGHSNMYQWKLYVRSPLPTEIFTKTVTKVLFDIHESFAEPERTVHSPGPFEVKECGWGEFQANITVYFATGGVFRTTHQLKLFSRDEDESEAADAQRIERHEIRKYVEIPVEALSEDVIEAVRACEAQYDRSADEQQLAEIDAKIANVEAAIEREMDVHRELDVATVFDDAYWRPKYA